MKNSHADDKARLSENHAIRNGAYDTRKFLELIEARCPSYSWVTAKLRGEMRLIILAKKDLAEEISNVYIAGENTGIGGVLANKVCSSAVSIKICRSMLCAYVVFLLSGELTTVVSFFIFANQISNNHSHTIVNVCREGSLQPLTCEEPASPS